MKKIISIQSHVAYGYVGNRAAVFPLQRLGHDVTAVNTLQFSNHTGYGVGQWGGDIFSSAHLQAVIDGVEKRGIIPELDAVLSGYMGDAILGSIIVDSVQRWRKQNPNIIYCCDPVIGDVGRDIFVKPEVAKFMKETAVEIADIITPNQFELSYLTDVPIHNFSDVVKACNKLHARGPKIILLTSLIHEQTPAHDIEMFVSSPEGQWKITTPKLPMPIAPNGAGDLTAAIFLAKYLETKNVVEALEHVTAAVYEIFEMTLAQGTRELQLICAQNSIVAPVKKFKATLVR